jgi:hypothetical protein
MAGKKKMQEQAVRYLRYELTNSETPGTETSHYIDLARDLSAINRRLYRQGRSYHVKRVSIVSSNTIAGYAGPGNQQNAGRVTFGVAPTSWAAANAWKRGFEAWRKMQSQAIANSSDVRPKYNDFKVHLSEDGRTATKAVPLDNGGNALSLGEWVYCKFQSPDGTTSADEFTAHILGGHTGATPGSRTSIGLIQSYADSRASVVNNSPYVPSTSDDDPLANLFDDGTTVDEVRQNMRDDNDDAPYDVFNYGGEGVNHPKPLVVHQTTLGSDGRSSVGGFAAMCGLLEVEITSPIANDVYSVLVELAPGSYRGIAADVIA